MEKHQIGIILAFVGIVVLATIYGIFAFGGDNGNASDSTTEQSRSSSRLPDIPTENQEELTSRIQQAEDTERAEKEAEMNKVNETPIDLDVFSLEDEDKSTAPVDEASIINPEPSKKSTVRSKSPTKRSQPKQEEVVPEPVIEPVPATPTIDPDLAFSSRSSSGSSKSLKEEKVTTAETLSIPCVIDEKVTVTNGGRITLRTTQAVTYKGKTIPSNTFLTATVTFNKNRIILTIPPIPCQGGYTLLEKLNAYDGNDLVLGLYAQELTENTGSEQTASDVLDDVGSEIPSGVARSVVRNLGKAKVRENNVTLRSNHPVVIKP